MVIATVNEHEWATSLILWSEYLVVSAKKIGMTPIGFKIEINEIPNLSVSETISSTTYLRNV